MWMIVGLGNPGEEYAGTRHNAGFETIALLAEEAGARYWKTQCGALVATGRLAGEEVVLAMPQSYMNTSGGPVKQLLAQYNIEPAQLIVIHDELDIAPGTIRAKFGGGHAGHNGLRSICDKLGTREWFRVRCGIGRPPGRMDTADYVLSRPHKEDLEAFQHACALAAEATPYLIANGLEKTQQKYN